MIRLAATLALLTGLWNCVGDEPGDESVAGHGAAGVTWALSELDGAPFAARATLGFPEAGRIAGQGPCNRYSGEQTVPYPWFATENITSTRRACPDLAAEQAFFAALAAMTLSEVAGDVLILRDDTGREMVFRATGMPQ